MTDVRSSAARSRGRRWRKTGGVAAAAAAAAILVPSMAMAATGATGATGTVRPPAAVQPGSLLSWGLVDALGNGDKTADVPVPSPALKGHSVSQVQGGCFEGIGLASTGDVLTWGNGVDGDLGIGQDEFITNAVQVKIPGAPTIVSVAEGCTTSLVLTADGAVWGWGDDVNGELGNGVSGVDESLPVQAKLPSGVRVAAISAGADFAMALTTTGQLYAWGDDAQGQLGDGGGHQFRSKPVLVQLPKGLRVTAVSAGGGHTLALTDAGLLLAWGSNNHGQLGNGIFKQRSTPFPVLLPSGVRVTAISAGTEHSLALVGNGTAVLSWGNNQDGDLGDGTTTDKSHPVLVKLHLNPGAKVRSISAGGQFSMALTTDQQLLTWGLNDTGQLGINSFTNSSLPVAAKLPKDAIVLAIGVGSSAENGYAIVP